MADYLVPQSCYGLTMEDGTKYNADRRGRIRNVENPNHQYHIERNAAIGGGHVHRSTGNVEMKTTGSYCRECRFVGWAWQKQCPKCGSELAKD